jgi:hypothetical protein
MQFLSAIGSLLLVLLFGGGSIIVGYFAWREYSASARPAWRRPELPKLTWDQLRNRAMVAFAVLLAGGVLALAISNRSLQGPQGEPGAQGPQGPAGPAGTAVRTIVSTSCAKDGCPVACEPEETLVTALCITRNGAKLADNLSVDRGQLRARCSSSALSIAVTCTPTKQ